MLQNLSNEEVGQLRNVYRQRMNAELPKGDAKELSLAYTLTNLPKDYTQTNMVERPSYARAQQDALIRGRAAMSGGGVSAGQQGNLFDTLPDATFAGGKITNGTALDNSGNPFNGEVYMKQQELPAQIFSVIGTPASKVRGFNVVFENGLPVKMINPRIGTITRQAMENYQLKYNTEPKKGVQPDYGEKDQSVTKKETLAEKMRRLKNK
jgi:hypothetical protein